MSLTDLVQSGTKPRAQRIVIFGPNGIGKSTLGAEFPDPIFLDCEDGTTHLAVNRILINDYASLAQALSSLRTQEHSYRTLVIDTIDRLELLLRGKVCQDLRIGSIESKPYGKGFTFLFEEFDRFLTKQLDPFIADGVHVVVCAHSSIKKVQLPGLEGFDRFELKIHQACAARLKEWCDALLFIDWQIHVIENEGRPKATGGKERTIFTRHSAAHDAKVRIDMPESLPCGFSAIEPLLCGWQRPEHKPLQIELAEALADIKPEQIRVFLIDRKQIRDDQDVTDVSTEYAREGLKRLPEFRQAVQDFDFIPM
jgi:hypothetical protein